MGIKNANSKYFCPWCCCSKDVRNDIQINWSSEIYERNWKENHSLCRECNDAPKPCTRINHGYSPDTNLLKFPFDQSNVVLDTLHALRVLRTSEILEKELNKLTIPKKIVKLFRQKNCVLTLKHLIFANFFACF